MLLADTKRGAVYYVIIKLRICYRTVNYQFLTVFTKKNLIENMPFGLYNMTNTDIYNIYLVLSWQHEITLVVGRYSTLFRSMPLPSLVVQCTDAADSDKVASYTDTAIKVHKINRTGWTIKVFFFSLVLTLQKQPGFGPAK